jgi:hypothetical protein
MRITYRRLALILFSMAAFAAFTMLDGFELNGQSQAAPGALPANGGAVRILAPQPGERLHQSFVTLRYAEVTPASASGSPTFELRLDARDPVRTTDTTYNFTGLAPGEHTVIIQIVDANNTPVPGTQVQIRFFAAQPASPPPGGTATGASGRRPRDAVQEAAVMPDGASSLSVLSIVGFGVLSGGLISALRTRPGRHDR